MDRDATLDDFVGPGAGEEDAGSEEDGGSEQDVGSAEDAGSEEDASSDESEATDASQTPDEAVTDASQTTDSAAARGPTSSWRADGAACETCGAVVQRRWQASRGLVCGECKEW